MTTDITTLRDYLKHMVSFREMHGPASPPEGYLYKCMEDFALQRGQNYSSEPLSDEEMAWLFDRIGTSRYAIKQCYYNAQMLLTVDPWLDGHELTYVEGYAVGSVLPVQHGWLSLNGKVVDLTLRLQEKIQRQSKVHKGRLLNRVIGEFSQPREYIGVGIETEYVLERMTETGMAGTLIDDWKADFPLLREDGQDVLICPQG